MSSIGWDDRSNYAGRRTAKSRASARDNSKRQSHLTVVPGSPYNTFVTREIFRQAWSLHGGDTASTGVRTRGMHAEPRRLVNPVEHNVAANTQLPLTA